MGSYDWKRRAAWLSAVAARIKTPEVSELLSAYADEMLAKAEAADRPRMKPARTKSAEPAQRERVVS